ncbi:tRNA-dihydrouridine synthase [Lachnospiraceae bacterium NK3A20]|nr:tRNA-dihydrouridine synthase [Lachnospiraceae bacterium NK3A20]
MKFYFAPLEGNTGFVYRTTHHEFFPEGMAQYFTPFVVSNYTKKLKTREKVDVLPENNEGTPTIPQILSNDVDEFLFTAKSIADMGYREVNINLGCPVRTVVVKHKGSGMLQDLERLDRFLDGICEGAEQILVDPDPVKEPGRTTPVPLRISVKTRLGYDNVEEAPAIFSIYEKYPISELIVHARTRAELYSGQPELSVFRAICENTRLPLCYNGNINTVSDFRKITALLSEAENTPLEGADPVSRLRTNLMIGRGLLTNPALVREITTGQKLGKDELRAFAAKLYERYLAQYTSFRGQSSGDTVVINRMKEFWVYAGRMFDDNGRFLKNIHKAKSRTEYEAAVRMIFANCALREPEDGIA